MENEKKEILYDHIPTKEELIGQFDFLGDENDPRSVAYKRNFAKPKIKWWAISIGCVCPFLVAFGLAYFLFVLGFQRITYVWLPVILFITYVVFNTKNIVIFFIKMYQILAPMRIREKCRFEPSCSEYMMASIKKYGLLKGIRKGVNRLQRCKIGDGGFDIP